MIGGGDGGENTFAYENESAEEISRGEGAESVERETDAQTGKWGRDLL